LSAVDVNGPLGTGKPLGVTSDGTVEFGGSTKLRPAALGSRTGLAGLVGILATGLLLCMAAPSTPDLRPQSVDALPPIVHMAGVFGVASIHLRSGVLIAALVAQFFAYVVAVRYAERLSPLAVITTVAAFCAIVVIAPPLFSTDVFSYQAYARMFVDYGVNPYQHGPTVLQLAPGFNDGVYPYIGAKWISTPSVYGPLFTLISGLFSTASIAASAFAFKTIAVVSCAITLTLIWKSARLRGLNPTRAIALFGLNPLVVLYGVGGGHNDLLMAALTTTGIYAVLTRRDRTAGAMVALGAAVKLTGGLVFPFALASASGLGGGLRRRGQVIGAAVAAIAVAAAGFAVFGAGLIQMPFTLDRVQNEGAWQSVPGFITTVLRLQVLGHTVGLLLGLAFVALTARLLLRVWRGELDWLDGLAWATLTILLTTSSLLPWYVTWLLPPVALCTTRRLWSVTLWFTGWVLFTTMLAYIPHGVAWLGV
jgi:hypothetical protein